MMGIYAFAIQIALINIISALAGHWELKLPTADSHLPPMVAISLQDHSEAFVSSAYCMTKVSGGGQQIYGYSRTVCEEECERCVWKKRNGLSNEAEWQHSLTAELARLLLGGGEVGQEGSHNNHHQQQQELIGSWVAEAPHSLNLTDDSAIEELAASLGVSIESTPVIPASSAGGGYHMYFHVSGKPSSVVRMLPAGFSSLTPVPAALKLHPLLEEHAAIATSGGEVVAHGLQIEIFPPPPRPGTGGGAYNNTNATTMVPGGPADPPAQSLSAVWVGLVSSLVGHENAVIMADGDLHVTIRGLTTNELYSVALEIARDGRVKWISPQGRLTASNYFASQQVQSGKWYVPDEAWGEPLPDKFAPFSAMGLTGKGQVVGVADTGLDWKSCFFRDESVTPKFKWDEAKRIANRKKNKYDVWTSKKHRKIRQYVAYMNAGEDEVEGHGTHVCGSVAGFSSEKDIINRDYAGVAPGAKIAFFDTYSKTEDNASSSSSTTRGFHLPTNVGKHVFPHAYKVGARVYVASFNYEEGGVSGQNAYSSMAKSLDAYSFKHQDFVVVISAGNTGGIASPAEAKNGLSVGSHYNPDRRDKAPGANELEKLVALSPTSPRGKTHDRRIKPDVVGPGSNIYSAASSDSANCFGVVKKGTSSANAVVAGAMLLVREYFTVGYYPDGVKNDNNKFTPLGSLLKAILINSGQAVSDGDTLANKINLPSDGQGWGGVNLASTLVMPSSPEGLQLKVYGKYSKMGPDFGGLGPTIVLNQTRHYYFTTSMDTHQLPLKVTLVWHDAPGQSDASMALVNDIDLAVKKRGDQRRDNTWYFPNGKAEADRVNNVEHIEIRDPEPGTKYTVSVTGFWIRGRQPYSLVICGPFDGSKKLVEDFDLWGWDDYTQERRYIDKWSAPQSSRRRRDNPQHQEWSHREQQRQQQGEEEAGQEEQASAAAATGGERQEYNKGNWRNS